jgi:hypothetical protein
MMGEKQNHTSIITTFPNRHLQLFSHSPLIKIVINQTKYQVQFYMRKHNETLCFNNGLDMKIISTLKMNATVKLIIPRKI